MAWVEGRDDGLRRMNDGKRGRPYAVPDTMMDFLAGLQQLLPMQYRQMEGLLRGLSRITDRVRPVDSTTTGFAYSELGLVCTRATWHRARK